MDAVPYRLAPKLKKTGDFIGRLLFPKAQRFERRRNVRVLAGAVLFGLFFSTLFAAMLCILYSQGRI